ncbi:MAG: tetratricopeptide repeat protein [Candidatus Xenobia bacterium]
MGDIEAALEEVRVLLARDEVVAAASRLRALRAVPEKHRRDDLCQAWFQLYTRLPRRQLRATWPGPSFGEGRLVGLSADTTRALTIGRDGSLKLWDVVDRGCVASFNPPSGAVCAAMTPDGRFAVSGSKAGVLHVWDLAGEQPVRTVGKDLGTLRAVAVSTDGRHVLSAGDQVKVWSVASAECLDEVSERTGCVQFTPDGRRAVSGQRVWDVSSGDSLQSLASDSPVRALAVTLDGQQVLAACEDGTLRRWRLSDGKLLESRPTQAKALGLSADGQYVLTDRLELLGPQAAHTLEGEPASNVALSSDARYAIADSGDGPLRTWWLDWELEDREPSSEFDERARAHVESMLSLCTEEASRAPQWTDEHLADLLYTLGCAGFGHLRPEEVRAQMLRAGPPAGAPVVVRVLNGASAGAGVELTHSVVIGQSSRADLVLTDMGLSREHARITRLRDGRFRIQDLGSANGTLVDGGRIESRIVKAGETFVLGAALEDGQLGVELKIARLPAGESIDRGGLARARCNRAALRLREGDVAGAIEESTAALELDPTLADAYAVRARAGKRPEDCERAIALRPDVARYHYIKAELLEGEAAIAACTRAIALNAVMPEPWALRAEAQRVRGEFNAAIEDASRAIALSPKATAAWRTRAQAREAAGHLEQAAADFRRLLDLVPDDAAAKEALKRLPAVEAERILVSVLSGQSAGCGVELRDSVVLGQASSADLVLTDLGLSRQHARLTSLGDGRYQLEDLASANGTFVNERRIDRCLLREGDSFHLGCIREDGSLGVEVQLGRANGHAPGQARLFHNRALAWLREGDPQAALTSCSEALKLEPEMSDAYATRAAARRQAGDVAGALEDCTRAIELCPDAAPYHLRRGEAYLQDGQREHALADANRAIELNPGLAEAWACRGEAKRLMGDLRGAVEDCTRAITLRPNLAAAYCTRARTADARGDLGMARADFKKLLEIDRDNEVAAEGMKRLASSSLPDLTDLPESIREKARLAVASMIDTEKRLGPDDPELAKQLNEFAVMLYHAKAYRIAAPLAERAVAILEQAKGPEDLDLAMFLQDLAHMLSGEYGNADPRAELMAGRALAIREKVLGPDHVDVATSLETLAWAQGVKARSRPLLMRALAIREKQQGPEHVEVCLSLYRIGHTYYNEGSFKSSVPYYERAISITEKAGGSDSVDLSWYLNHLGQALYNAREADRARQVLERCIAIREKHFGSDHREVARPLMFLGHLEEDAGRLEQARAHYERALSIREQRLPADHVDIGWSLLYLADLHVKMRNHEAARPLYQKALALRTRIFGEQHADVLAVENKIRRLPPAQGKDAIAAAESSLDKLRLIKGAEHPEVAVALTRLADMYRNEGYKDKALAMHERALAIREKVLGPHHLDVADSLNNIALLHFSNGDYEKAAPLQERALKIRENPTRQAAAMVTALAPAPPAQVPISYATGDSPRLCAFLEAAVALVAADRGAVLVPEENGAGFEIQAAYRLDEAGMASGAISRRIC